MNKAEKILIIDRFEDCVDEISEILSKINSDSENKVTYSTSKLASVNLKFRETIKQL
jgi:hypothetical protein